VATKAHYRQAKKGPQKGRLAERRRLASPKAVRLAIRRLLDTTNHIHARAAALENALEALRDQERTQALKELLLALRNSPNGDILGHTLDASTDGRNSPAEAIIEALVEAFAISPSRSPGERISLQNGQIPDKFELDRSIGQEQEDCAEVEVISSGWNYKNYPLLKPVVRPILSQSR
jgi:hypothetical protein